MAHLEGHLGSGGSFRKCANLPGAETKKQNGDPESSGSSGFAISFLSPEGLLDGLGGNMLE